MKGNKLGFIPYEDKKLELKNYVATKFCDILNMKENKVLMLANEETPSEDIVLEAQFYLDESTRVLFLIYHIINDDDEEKLNDLYKFIDSEFNRYTYEDERVEVQIIVPEKYEREETRFVSRKHPNGLDDSVYSYWSGLNGEYEFICDKRMNLFDKYNKIAEYEFTRFNEYKQQIFLINNKYAHFDDPSNIPLGFEEYKSIYSLYFDRAISTIPENNIIRFKLCNIPEENNVLIDEDEGDDE